MSQFTQASHALADRMRIGEHQLYNQDLRDVYGLARVTVKARGEIADALERAGLEVLSDPVAEPLIVRKLAAGRAPRRSRPTRRPRWRKPWALAGLGLLLLFILVGALSGDEPTAARDGRAAQPQDVAQTPHSTATPTQTLVDARAAVREDDYDRALVIAAALGEDEKRGVSKRISRRLAFRATRALRTDRRAAARLLREARDHPSTPEVRQARRALDAAQARARARAAAERRARAAARQERGRRAEARRQARAAARQERARRAEARRQARAEARRRAEAESAPSTPSAPETSEPSTSGPSTTNWCGKRDGDGDGIYCEGL